MHYIVKLESGYLAQEYRFYTWKKAHKFAQQALIHSMNEKGLKVTIEIEGSNLAQLTTLNQDTEIISEGDN